MPRKEWALATSELYWALTELGAERLVTMPSRLYTFERARALVSRAQMDMQQPKK